MYPKKQYPTFNGIPLQPINKVIDQSDQGAIFIGDIDSAKDIDLLRRLGIGAVLTVAPDANLHYSKNDIFMHSIIHAQDEDYYDLSQHFPHSYEFIDNARQYTNILVHCQAGVSRSTTIVIAYLMRKYSWRTDQSYKIVKAKRRLTCPNLGFCKQLKQFQRQLGLVDTPQHQQHFSNPTIDSKQKLYTYGRGYGGYQVQDQDSYCQECDCYQQAKNGYHQNVYQQNGYQQNAQQSVYKQQNGFHQQNGYHQQSGYQNNYQQNEYQYNHQQNNNYQNGYNPYLNNYQNYKQSYPSESTYPSIQRNYQSNNNNYKNYPKQNKYSFKPDDKFQRYQRFDSKGYQTDKYNTVKNPIHSPPRKNYQPADYGNYTRPISKLEKGGNNYFKSQQNLRYNNNMYRDKSSLKHSRINGKTKSIINGWKQNNPSDLRKSQIKSFTRNYNEYRTSRLEDNYRRHNFY